MGFVQSPTTKRIARIAFPPIALAVFALSRAQCDSLVLFAAALALTAALKNRLRLKQNGQNMKLATFTEAHRRRIGIVEGESVIDLAAAAPHLPQSMMHCEKF